MSFAIKRRSFLQGTAGLAVTAGAGTLGTIANAKETLTAVEWGPPWIDASKAVAEGWDKADIVWELHAGGAAAIIGKIKATWPNSPYDLIDNWSPVFISMNNEGWAETITLDDVPNLKDIPENLITKDKDGNWKNIPRSINGNFFAVRPDLCPIEINTIEDLLSPELAGQICWPSPIMQMNMQTIILAMARGGNEQNMEPGWKFLEELVRAGNIGRVYQTTTDVINSMTTGETCVTFGSEGTIASVAARVPVTRLTKVDPTLKAGIFTEGWVVMSNSTKKEAAFEFANFTINPENSELFHQTVGGAPANTKAKAPDSMAHLTFTPEEFEQYALVPDFTYVVTQIDGWVKRFEQDIQPLL